MKKIFLLLIISTNIMALSNKASFRGGVNGGGADFGEDDHFGWFLKGFKSHISVCVEKSDNFGVSENKIEETIKKSYGIWDDYIVRKNIYENDVDVDVDDDLDPVLLKFQNNIKIQFLKKCTDADLTFYLGVETKDVKNVLVKLNDPIAVTHKTHAFFKNGWSKGFIWLKNISYWNENKNLEMIILHEIGHTLGNGHKSGTIMSRDIARFLAFNSSDYTDIYLKYKESIDWEGQLVICYECIFENGAIWLPKSNHEKLVLDKIFGKKVLSTDNISSKFQLLPSEISEKMISGNYIIKINDKEFQYKLNFHVRNLTIPITKESIFSRQRKYIDKDGVERGYEIDSSADLAMLLGEIDLGDKKMTFIFENNLMSNTFFPPVGEIDTNDKLFWNPTGVSAYVVDGGEKYYLFSRINVFDTTVNKNNKRRNYFIKK